MTGMKKKAVLFFSAFLVWILLSWVPDWKHLLAGVLVSGVVAVLTGELFIQRPGILKNPKRYFYFLAVYLPAFLWEAIKANVDVARRILRPDLTLRPGIVRVKTVLKSDVALTFLANSITFASGMMLVDTDRENGVLYVHSMEVQGADLEAAAKRTVERFEKILQKIFE